jgi:hypothetical protein
MVGKGKLIMTENKKLRDKTDGEIEYEKYMLAQGIKEKAFNDAVEQLKDAFKNQWPVKQIICWMIRMSNRLSCRR